MYISRLLLKLLLSVTVWLARKVLLCRRSSSCFICHRVTTVETDGLVRCSPDLCWLLPYFLMIFFIFIPLFYSFSNGLVHPTGAVCCVVDSSCNIKGNADTYSCRWLGYSECLHLRLLKTQAAFNWSCVFCGCPSECLFQLLFQWFRGCCTYCTYVQKGSGTAYSLYGYGLIKCEL